MKTKFLRSLLITLLLLSQPLLSSAVVTTTNIGLKIPDIGVQLPLTDPNNFAVLMNNNLLLIDAQFTGGFVNLSSPNTWPGVQTFSASTIFADGTALLPSLTFGADLDTGIYHTADNIHFSTAGVTRLTISSTGIDLISGGYSLGGSRVLFTSFVNSSTLVGEGAGSGLLSTGLANTAVGKNSLGFATTGDNNTSVGTGSQVLNIVGSDNTTTGANSLASNTTGAGNSALGSLSLFTATGSQNTALGFKSGDNITTGSHNIILGSDIDAPIATGSDQLNIGNVIFGTGIDGVNAALSTGNIGIGVVSPTSKLHVVGTFNTTGASVFGGDIDFNSGTLDFSTQATAITLNNSTAALNIDANTFVVDAANNRVGFGVLSPANKIDVDGGIHISGTLPGNTANALYQTAGVLKWSGMDISPFTAVAGSITGYDVSTASFVDTLSIVAKETNITGAVFNGDGTKLYIVGIASDAIHEYDLSPAYDTSTAVFVDSLSTSAQSDVATDLAFNGDGTKLYLLNAQSPGIHEYDLSPAYDTSTAVFVDFVGLTTHSNIPTGMTFNGDGTKVYVVRSSGVPAQITEYDLSPAYDTSTAVFVDNFSVSAQDTTPTGLVFNDTGSKVFVTGFSSSKVHEYDLSPAYDTSTAVFVGFFAGGATEGLMFNNGGTNLYLLDDTSNNIVEYSLTDVVTPPVTHPTLFTSNLGINTSSPTEKLHVVGNVRIVDGNQALNKILTSDASGVGTWQAASVSGLTNIVEDLTPQLGGNLDVNGNSITSTTGLDISIGAAAGNDFTIGTSKFVVEGDTGNVGIATTTPVGVLHVGKNVNTLGGILHLTQSGANLSAGNSLVYIDGSGQFGSDTWYALHYKGFSSASDLVLTTSGKLGIGTTTPTSILEIQAESGPDLRLTTAGIGSLVTGRRSGGTVGAPTTTPTNATLLFLSGQSYGATTFGESASISFNAASVQTEISRPGRIEFHTVPSGGTARVERMRIDQSGNVGIGTTTPAFKLHVVGSTNVNGTKSDVYNQGGGDLVGPGTFWEIRTNTSNDFNLDMFGIGGTDRAAVTVKQNGDVGIGDTSPEVRLDVEGGTFTVADSAVIASVTTTALPVGNLFHISGVAAITTLNTCDAGNNGRTVTLIFDGILTLTDGLNLKLAGNFVTTADDSIQLICDGANWYEISRSVN